MTLTLSQADAGLIPPCFQLGTADNANVLLSKTEAAHVHVSHLTAPGSSALLQHSRE